MTIEKFYLPQQVAEWRSLRVVQKLPRKARVMLLPYRGDKTICCGQFHMQEVRHGFWGGCRIYRCPLPLEDRWLPPIT